MTDQPNTTVARFIRTLVEVAAACDESARFGRSGWVRTFALSGSAEDRSLRRLKALMRDGHIEGRKPAGAIRQVPWLWRVTETGREAIKKCSCTK